MFPKDSFSCSGDLVQGGLGVGERVHHFCKSCLNFIYSELSGAGQRVNLRTSLLNEAHLFEPYVELMVDEKLPWVQAVAQRSYARFPETREELLSLMQDYANRRTSA